MNDLTDTCARGDTVIEINHESHRLSLTLAALAEIEAGLGVSGFTALGEALKTLDAARLSLVLTALLRAGGADNSEALAKAAEPLQAAQAVARCFKANLA